MTIYYFSGTGNSEWVACQLAEKTDDTAKSMVDMVKSNETPVPVGEHDVLDCISCLRMVYSKYVTDFVKRIEIHKNAFVYAVATCESETGFAFTWLKWHIRVNSCYSVKMPNNYTLMGFGTQNEAVNHQKILEAKIELETIADSILARRKENKILPGVLPFLKSFVIAPIFRISLSDKGFHADYNCTGCGKCETSCPISDIQMVNNKPV